GTPKEAERQDEAAEDEEDGDGGMSVDEELAREPDDGPEPQRRHIPRGAIAEHQPGPERHADVADEDRERCQAAQRFQALHLLLAFRRRASIHACRPIVWSGASSRITPPVSTQSGQLLSARGQSRAGG